MSHEELTTSDLQRLYYFLVLTRKCEETLITLYHSGKIRGHPHSSIGQEAIGVGCTFGLDKDDWVSPSLRTLGAMLTKGVHPRSIFAEAYRRQTGPSGGKYLYHHLGDPENRVLVTSAVVGGSIPVAVGVALAAKLRGTRQVTVVFFGDGATSRGDFHEAINMAAVLNVPAIFVCENNLYALSTPQSKQMRITDIADRAVAYGIPGIKVDGSNVLEVHHHMQAAVDRARQGSGPTLLECKTYRWRGHSEIDTPAVGRSSEELEYWQNTHDPIKKLKEDLKERGVLDEVECQQVQTTIEGGLKEAVSFAEASPEPAPEEALTRVFV